MKTAKITARVKNSPIMPVKEFTAVETLEFPDNENVFGRVLLFRQHFRKKYGQDIEVDLISCIYLDSKEA